MEKPLTILLWMLVIVFGFLIVSSIMSVIVAVMFIAG